jgi:hypothetical protein
MRDARYVSYFLGFLVLLAVVGSVIDMFIYDMRDWYGTTILHPPLIGGFVLGLGLGLAIVHAWPKVGSNLFRNEDDENESAD